MVGIVSHDRGHIEGHAQPGLALLQQVAIAPVGVGGIAETGKLAHRPEAPAVHIGLHTPGKGIAARKPQVAQVIELRRVVRRVKIFYLFPGYCLKGFPALPLRVGLFAPLSFGLLKFFTGIAVAGLYFTFSHCCSSLNLSPSTIRGEN